MSGNNKQAQKQELPASRDDIRAAIFGAKPNSTTIEFFGHNIELRQPTLGDTMAMRRANAEDATVQMLVQYAFVPGTNDHVFEETDADSIRNIPFGPDMLRLSQAVNALIGVTAEGLEKQVGEAEKSSSEGLPEDSSDVGGVGAGED